MLTMNDVVIVITIITTMKDENPSSFWQAMAAVVIAILNNDDDNEWYIQQRWLWDEYDDFGIKGEFTLFAPTDLAFNEFLQKLGGVKVVSFMSHLSVLNFLFTQLEF